MEARDGNLDTPIRWPLRAWMGVEVLFGLAAIITIFLKPDDTENNFAWPIDPTVMAATLGAFYLASALIFVLPLFAKRWQDVRVMIIPTAMFSLAMIGATILHWDKFSVGSAPFYIWLASYVLPPPIFIGLYLWHQRDSAPVGAGVERPMSAGARAFFRYNGAVLLAVALTIYVFPSLLIDVAAWGFTPLTARTLCGWLIGISLMQIWMSREGDWGRAKLATTMLMVLPLSMTFQLLRFSSQVDWGNVMVWVLLADVAAVGLLSAYLWATAGGRAIEARAQTAISARAPGSCGDPAPGDVSVR